MRRSAPKMKPRKKNSSQIGATTQTNTAAPTSAAVLLLTPSSLGSLSRAVELEQRRVQRGDDVVADAGDHERGYRRASARTRRKPKSAGAHAARRARRSTARRRRTTDRRPGRRSGSPPAWGATGSSRPPAAMIPTTGCRRFPPQTEENAAGRRPHGHGGSSSRRSAARRAPAATATAWGGGMLGIGESQVRAAPTPSGQPARSASATTSTPGEAAHRRDACRTGVIPAARAPSTSSATLSPTWTASARVDPGEAECLLEDLARRLARADLGRGQRCASSSGASSSRRQNLVQRHVPVADDDEPHRALAQALQRRADVGEGAEVQRGEQHARSRRRRLARPSATERGQRAPQRLGARAP